MTVAAANPELRNTTWYVTLWRSDIRTMRMSLKISTV
jgi:hypothetical protein